VGQVVHLGNVFPFLDKTTSVLSSSTSPSPSGSSSGSIALNEDTNTTTTNNTTSQTPTSDINITSTPLKLKQGNNTKAKAKAEIEAEAEAARSVIADEKTQSTLEAYGPEMWEFLQRRDGRGTTRALNIFKVGGEARE
jgi:hypothetical protein